MPELQRVVVERAFDEAKVFDELQRAELAVDWCLKQHDVRFRRSYLSLDGRSMVCFYDAPDTESVRAVQRRAGLPFTRAWAATELTRSPALGAPHGLSTVVVERERPDGLPLETTRAMLSAPPPCFDLHRAELLATHLAHDTRRLICLFSAPDAESVRRANQQAAQAFVRAWTATLHLP
jgi:hypothetical protein